MALSRTCSTISRNAVKQLRIALVSDIHGNAIALDGVLAECRTLGVDQFWFIGDFAAIGPEPSLVLERVTSQASAIFTRGNTDRYLVTGELPPPDLAAVQSNPALVPTYAAISASFAWTQGFLAASGWLEWLGRLPLDHRLTAPNGTRILAVHASPGTDDGNGVHPGQSNEALAQLVAGSEADVVFVGHTHEPMIRRVGAVLLVNIGSVSNPRSPDLRASYVLLDITDSGIELEHRRVSYDHKAFIDRVHRSRHPATDFILSHQRGERSGRTPHRDHVPLLAGARFAVAGLATTA